MLAVGLSNAKIVFRIRIEGKAHEGGNAWKEPGLKFLFDELVEALEVLV